MEAAVLSESARSRWGLVPRAGLVLVLGVIGWLVAAPVLAGVTVEGEVRDGQTGGPLGGVTVRVDGQSLSTGPDGRFALGSVLPWRSQTLTFEAAGYEGRSLTAAWPPEPLRVTLPPRMAEVGVVDDDTGQPVAATVESAFGRVEALAPGRFRLAPIVPGTRLVARAEGYRPVETAFDASGQELRLAPIRAGRVLDAATGRPLPGALILADEQLFTAGPEGQFELPARPKRPLRVTMPGYRRLEADTSAAGSLELRLEPFAVRGLYLTFYGVADDGLRENALKLLETTEANAVVIDVKGDRGYLSYRSRVPLAEKIGANSQPSYPEMRRLLADLRARGYYTVARLVVMKDDLLARNGPEAGLDVAIKDRRTGKVWVDGEGLGWVDPFRTEVWDYNVALAIEAAELGFDEVQYDYIRFPTDPSSATTVNAAVYSKELTEENRVAAIAGLLEQTHRALKPMGTFLGIDTFGYTCFRDDDLGIGQNLARLASHVDFISPMIYPSTYNAGLPNRDVGFPAVVARPYEVIYESMVAARQRTEGTGAILRPWLQYFDDYPWQTGRRYNAAEIEAQKKASAEAGASGWMMWDPFNKYARGGFAPR